MHHDDGTPPHDVRWSSARPFHPRCPAPLALPGRRGTRPLLGPRRARISRQARNGQVPVRPP
ncbi:hypothetical protein ACF1B0_34435 [Streptomyces anandii]|uniref:hypothetical protein n=1 Tax=Streptomyces anandii TaxID=285454 RepID=UPI0036FAC904